ncbi:MAG: SH3 domain-containing protein [Tatlockia sp.]|nr:SH3 domain-containing protein [Tatlockia sp.]
MFKKITLTILCFITYSVSAINLPIHDFSLKPYSQNIEDFFPPNSSDYPQPLVNEEFQKQQLKRFYNHYFASDSQSLSPWGENLVRAVLPIVKNLELENLQSFNNKNKANSERHYAENFKEQSQKWWSKLKYSMNLDSLQSLDYKAENRAIAVNNSFARGLPDSAPDFFHVSLPGQGFPFDNLQESAIWAGTPLYVITTTRDRAWSLVLTPDAYFDWIKSSDLAYASPEFISQWQQAAKKNLVAIAKTDAPLFNREQDYILSTFIGSVFPLKLRAKEEFFILVPAKDEQAQAFAKVARVSADAAVLMPLVASPKNFSAIIKQLINRPYGWGGAFFFNDCSQELKSLFTPFGIWLPRNSRGQSELKPSLDLSHADINERLAVLKSKGHPLMTLVYIGGHVFLYLGEKNQMAISYQNVWGLSPANRDKRYVIGQSVLLPIVKSFQENSEIDSQANRNFFKMVFLDELTATPETPREYLRLLSEQPDYPQDLRN